ncbi:MAG: oligopeptide transporter, OPT family [Termitinemataceae bacterium]|nr:MAG: oligopeptide transporter, OPT family [Termitinemataceae bacterium]
MNRQLTIRSLVIGGLGSALITMSSMYVALKLGALPWPIIFAALVSMFFLKLLGNTNMHEINVTHTAMSAGAMTSGGMAFTLPGIYMLNPNVELNFLHVALITSGGVLLGLIWTAIIRKNFIETQDLHYAMGEAAAETISAGDEGGKKARSLFAFIGASGVFTFLRDGIPDFFGKTLFPAAVMNNSMMKFGSSGGIWLSPMLISIGYIVGPLAIGVWFLGALIGDFIILIGGTKLGFLTSETAVSIKSSLGIGLMVGTGIAIILKSVIQSCKNAAAKNALSKSEKSIKAGSFISLRWAPVAIIITAFLFTVVCKMGVIASIVTILGSYLATLMSAQVVGQSGINPMEIFAIIILLAAKALCGASGFDMTGTSMFMVAAAVAIACGLAGDVLNDFKAGAILKTDPKAQWIAQCAGGIVGVAVSVAVFYVLVKAYGGASFGAGKMFSAPQAAAVASMVGGIPHLSSFICGLIAACVLYMLNVPVMTLGLGVYLPFFLSFTAFLGGALSLIAKKCAPSFVKDGNGLIVASGLLGGEAFVGVVIAMIKAFSGFASH